MAAATVAQTTPGAVEALNHFNDMVTRYCESQMFFAACGLGVFDQLAAGPATAEEYDRSGTPFGLLMSLHMLVLCEPGARERSEAEYAGLLEETGFRVEKLVRMAAPRDLLVARKM